MIIKLLLFQIILIITIINLINSEILERNQEVPYPSQVRLRPDLVPRSLLVSRPPSGVYSGVGVRVPTPPDNVPDVITYLTT